MTHPASRENTRLAEFVVSCCLEGRISETDKEAVFFEFNAIMKQVGIDRVGADDISVAVIRQTTHLMKKKLLELHPELTDEVRNLGAGHNRYETNN